MPSIGETSLVKPKFTLAVSTAAAAAVTRGLGSFYLRLRGLHLRFRGSYLRFLRLIGLHGVVQILLRDRLLLRQRNVSILIELRFLLIRLGARQLCLRLNQSRLALATSCALACASCPSA